MFCPRGRHEAFGGLLVCVMAAIGCSAPVPLGVYRLPVQTGAESLQLKTFFVRLEGEELVLRDVGRDEEFGRAISRTSWMGEPQPYSFGKLGGYPFTLYVRDGVIEDVETRPWQTQPVPPLVSGELTATLAVVGSDGGELRLLKAGDLLFAEAPVTPPASDAVPDPLVVLGSVAVQAWCCEATPPAAPSGRTPSARRCRWRRRRRWRAACRFAASIAACRRRRSPYRRATSRRST